MVQRKLPGLVYGDNDQSFLTMGLAWSNKNPIDTELSRSEGRYITILQVKDYVRLSLRLSGVDIFEPVPDFVTADIRTGKSILVLDLCNEGPAFDKEIFDHLHESLVRRKIPRHCVIFVNQNRLLGVDYSKIYGSGGITFVFFDYFVKLLLMRLAGSSIFDSRYKTEVEEYEPGIDSDPKLLLSMNATPRWHRILIFRWLTIHGLVDDSLVSFHGANLLNPKSSEIDLSTIPPQIPRAFAPYISNLEAWMPEKPIRFDAEERKGNDLADSLETWAYRKTYFSLVTESDFFERTERLTEKAIKAAGLGHPFIIVGAPRSLSALSELGFELFSDVIDPSYDRDHDPVSRLNDIFGLILKLRDDIRRDAGQWLSSTREQARFNHLHGKGPVQKRFERLIEDPLIARMERFVEVGRF